MWLNLTTPNFASDPRTRTSGGVRPFCAEVSDLNVPETSTADKTISANTVKHFMTRLLLTYPHHTIRLDRALVPRRGLADNSAF
jgi:hypothetical protein